MGTNMVVHNGPGMHVSESFLIRAYNAGALIKFEFYVHGFSGNTPVVSVMQYVKLLFAVSTSSMEIHHLFAGQ